VTTLPPASHDPVDKALRMLALLDDAGKEQVLDRMSPELRERIEQRIATMPDTPPGRPHANFSQDIAEQRRLLRQTAERLHEEKMRKVREAIAADGMTPHLPGPSTDMTSTAQLLDPLGELRYVHPAAIARAMQGERAEAWAIVLDRLDEKARAALESYLDGDALGAIQQARIRQAELRHTASALAATIEKAIARTVVPIALREHQLLTTNYPAGAPHGTAF
jgi:hypothetical protein